jgi:hypothetical protein
MNAAALVAENTKHLLLEDRLKERKIYRKPARHTRCMRHVRQDGQVHATEVVTLTIAIMYHTRNFQSKQDYTTTVLATINSQALLRWQRVLAMKAAIIRPRSLLKASYERPVPLFYAN